jgi:hypothetical protein
MIPDLEHKANNEKYFKSIRYFSHSLKGENRRNFIIKVAKYNIYLAAQCIMSAEKDEELENELMLNSSELSTSKNIRNRVLAFLSLAELNRYDEIYKILSQIELVEKEHRITISLVINEADAETILMFLELVIKSGLKSLVSTIITSIERREINFTFNQIEKIKQLYNEYLTLHPQARHVLRFCMGFNLPKNYIPSEKNLLIITSKLVKDIDFIKSFYQFYQIEFPITNYQLCKIYLGRNRQSSVFNFGKIIFQLEEKYQKELLGICISKGKYFSAFFASLIRDKDERMNFIKQHPNSSDFISLMPPFLNKQYEYVNQELLKELYTLFFQGTLIPERSDVFECIITYIIPQTIFVEILATNQKGSIWVKEFTTTKCNDARKIAKIGQKIYAVIIGRNDKYLSLSKLQAE